MTPIDGGCVPSRPSRSARPIILVLLLGLTAYTQAQPPELDYLQHCAGCHREDGSGSARNGVPDMRGILGRFAASEAGRAYLVQVAGIAQSPLSDARLATLLNWMLPRYDAAGTPAEFIPYSAAEVANLRRTRPGDLPAARAHALSQQAGSNAAPNTPTAKETDTP